jgi:hypothetical protein
VYGDNLFNYLGRKVRGDCVENVASIFITIVWLIPIYVLSIWTYLYPEDSFLLGKRWMFKEESEPSQKVIRYAKFSSMTVMIGLPIVVISLLVEVNILKLVPLAFLLVLIVGAMIILTKEDNS